ncbi:MAG: HDOD domain-containing protein [Planctomycetes bacterium]|nr:HDOD domain-containing protein [Planctomycetota bacterium]
MGKHEAQHLLGDRLTLPSLPEVVTKLNAMINDPKVGLHEIGAVVAHDAAITAKVLRIANSSYYGLKEPVLSAEQAATVVGARSLRNIALQASVFARYEHLAALPDFDLEAVWRHAIYVAQLAQTLARESRRPLGLGAEEFYTCGLLHDIGKVVMLESLGPQYVAVVQEAKRAQQAVHLVEARMLGFTHVDVGALVASRWKLPEVVARSIEFHHGPQYEVLATPAVAVVAVADQIAYRAELPAATASLGKLAEFAHKALGVEAPAFEHLLAYAREIEALIEV